MTRLPSPLSHAYLITGGSEGSRMELAKRMAAAYLCGAEAPPCGQCRACRKAAAGIHPDVSLTAPPQDKREIGVEQVRALRAGVHVRPNEGRRKVYLIAPADAMNPSAQNALLKVLEEGPAYAAFLLCAGQPGRLLDTVRSRCELLALPPEEPEPDPALLERAEGLARLLLEGDELTVARRLTELELGKPKAEELGALLALAEERVSRRLAQCPRRGSRVLQALKTCRENAVYRPSPGMALGQIITRIF